MKAIIVAIATIALAGCTTYPNEEGRKANLAAAPIATSTLAGEDEIRPNCEKKWPGNYSMIADCIEIQTQGFRAVQRLLEEHNIRNGDTTPEAKIFADCSRNWRSGSDSIWSMIAWCFERQLAGYRRLYPNE